MPEHQIRSCLGTTTLNSPLPQFAIAQRQNVKTIATVLEAINIDGVDMKFNAIVVLEGHIPKCLDLD